MNAKTAKPVKTTKSAKTAKPPKPAGTAASKAASTKAEGAKSGQGGGPGSESVRELMVQAYAMESEAAERYAEFADVMEVHNNGEVAELFRKMARIENLHAQQIRESMGWSVAPIPAGGVYRWEGVEAPETADHGDLHYMMTAYHALKIARRNEERAREFYAKLAAEAPDESFREAAEEMRDEEAEHVRLIDDWLARTPAPEKGWSTDLDPPNYNE